jgi:RNA polymerase sigma-70 factor (ECF subfamily)
MAFTIALRMLKNREEAEEISQDAFLKAYKSLKSFKKKSKFSTWLYKIVYNLCISKLRKKQPDIFSIDEKEEQNYDLPDTTYKLEDLEYKDKKHYLEKAIEQLNEEEQTIILLFYHEDMSIEEIAKIVNLTISNVKVKLFRGRKRLYEHLNQLLKSETKNIL